MTVEYAGFTLNPALGLPRNANMVAIELVQLEHEGVHVRPGG